MPLTDRVARLALGLGSGCVVVGPAAIDEWRERHPDGASYLAIAVGSTRTCALAEGGAIECWGGAWDPDPPPGSWERIAVEAARDDDLACVGDADEVRCWRPGQPDVATYPAAADLDVDDGAICGVRDGRVDCYGLGASEDPRARIGGEATSSQVVFVEVRTRGRAWCGLTEARDVVCAPFDGADEDWGAFAGPFDGFAMGAGFVATWEGGLARVHGPAASGDVLTGEAVAALASDGCQVCGIGDQGPRCEPVGAGCADYDEAIAALAAGRSIARIGLSGTHVCLLDAGGCITCAGSTPREDRGAFGEPACPR